jgi:hypothetical protein
LKYLCWHKVNFIIHIIFWNLFNPTYLSVSSLCQYHSLMFICLVFYFFFILLLLSELRALCLLGRCFTTWATPPACCVLLLFGDRVSLFPRLLFQVLGCSWDDRHTPHHTQLFSVDIDSCNLFCLSCPSNCDPPNPSFPCSLGWQAWTTAPS